MVVVAEKYELFVCSLIHESDCEKIREPLVLIEVSMIFIVLYRQHNE